LFAWIVSPSSLFCFAVVSLVVIPEGDLLLFLPLPVLAVACSCRCLFLPSLVLAVILSAAKDPGTLRTAHTARTFLPKLLGLVLSRVSRKAIAARPRPRR
jgi:hypothetical protein